jgi:hypothetical protein
MVGYGALTCSALIGIVSAASAVSKLCNRSEYRASRSRYRSAATGPARSALWLTAIGNDLLAVRFGARESAMAAVPVLLRTRS